MKSIKPTGWRRGDKAVVASVAALATSSLLDVADVPMLAGEDDRQVENIGAYAGFC